MLRYEKITDLGGLPAHGLWNRSVQTPVLFLHGLGATGMSWLNVALPLDRRCGVLAPDLPGHGGSRTLFSTASLQSFSEMVEELVQALGGEAIHLVGHSMGGAVAVTLVERARLRIASLTLVACAGVTGAFKADFFDRYIGAESADDMAQVLATAVGPNYAVPPVMARSAFAEVRAPGAQPILREIARVASTRVYTPVSSLSGLQGPISVIWGEADPITPVSDAAAFESWAQIDILPGVGHMPHIEAPQAVHAAIERNIWKAAEHA